MAKHRGSGTAAIEYPTGMNQNGDPSQAWIKVKPDGRVDVFSKAPTSYSLWKIVTRLNERHPLFAWLSLGSVGLTDLYIRLVSMGVLRDLRLF